jgi:hypothetical protein
MLPYRDSRLTRIALVVFFVLVLAYAYFEARGFLFGPTIDVPSSVTEVHDPLVHISGKAERISSLAMNGKQIAVTVDGSFDEPYLLAQGLNRIVLDATDKYGRSRRQVIEIVYTPIAASSTSAAATSTPAEASTTPVAQ